MQIILDHITSILIAGVILLIFVYLQMRGTASANEATINHMVYSEVLQINNFLERDLENMLTQSQTEAAIAAGNFTGGSGVFACSLLTANNRATEITFPTLVNPDSTMGSPDPLLSEAMEVTYLLEATGDSTTIPINNVNQRVPTFRLNRYVDAKSTAISSPIITHFLSQFGNQGSNNFLPADTVTPTTTQCDPTLAKVRYDYKLAAEGIEFIARNQRSTSTQNISRFGATVSLSNWE